jgi:chemosensory pili system protein ChpA (sensor histidine kinase/response regulator)
MARELEHAMEWTQLQNTGTPEEGRVFTAAAEEIRRLLHQFAAGFLKEPNPEIAEALQQLHADKISGAAPLHPSYAAMDAQEDAEAEEAIEAKAIETAENPAIEPEPEATSALATEPVPELAPEPLPAPELVTTWATPHPVLRPQAKTILLDEPELVQDDEDLEAVDALEPDLFQIFEEEASDLLPMLGGALRQWAARPDNRSARAEVLRVLHTLKGSARLAGAMRLGERAHRIETAVERLENNDRSSDSAHIEPLLASFDALQSSFESLRLMDAEATQASANAAPIALHESVDESTVVPLVSAAPTEASDEPTAVASEPTAADALPITPPSLMAPLPRLTAGPARASAGQAVRIRSQLLDRLVNQTGEVMMTRSRLEAGVGQLRASLGDLTGNLERLRQQLRDVELQAELQMQSRLAKTRDADRSFDPLEFDRFTRVQELTRMMAESVNDVATVQRNLQRTLDGAEADLLAQARQTRELQRDLLRTRMMEFELISERLYRVVRQAAKDSGKQVKLDITGGSIEMDRGVLDRLTPAFEHLLRNAVAHGIEDLDIRTAAGKPAVGTLTIALNHAGNDVSIAFTDDGAGLNRIHIRDKALTLGLVTEEQSLEDTDLLNLVFMPGFSTAASITELSGRGIGMDVVRSEVLALGGRIESSFELGQGTRFNLILPLTTAVTQVVMVRAGRLSFGVPANVVEQVRRTPVTELSEAYTRGLHNFAGEDVPFFWSGALLQASPRSEEPVGKSASVVVFRSAQQRVALHVDEVLGNQEVVVKNLGPQLSRLPGLSGMTVLASGAVVLIYNPVALASVYGAQAKRFQTSQFLVAAAGGGYQSSDGLQVAAPEVVLSQVPLVLVVDDSITVRRVTQRLLQREGYRVALAVDGIQALDRLREEIPAVLLSDIEMPRMDGFELARSVRVSAAWKNLPIITISSRTAEKHREMARSIGVNHYLGKPYGEEELLSLIRRYAQPLVPV